MKRIPILSLILVVGVSGARAQSGAFAGPFLPGSGSYDTIPGGTFELDDPLDGWFGLNNAATLTSVDSPDMRGDRIGSMVSPFAGNYASLKQLGNVLTVGQTYVLSGFFRTDTLGGAIGFDVGNYGGQAWYQASGIFVPADSTTIGEWFFGYTTFVADNPSMMIRLVRGWETIPNATNYFDDIAVTAADSFVAPTPVPEPGTLAALGLGVAALRRRRRG